jgi:hypothetical protein
MKKFSIEIKWAIIFSVVSMLWMCFEKLIGLHDEYIEKHATYTNFFAVPAIAVYAFALLDKRDNYYTGFMTWKQGFICGLIITLIVCILTPVSNFITFKFITPDYFTSAIDFVTSTGLKSRPDAEAQFNFNSYLVQGALGAAVLGTITAAIVSFFVKRTKKQ